MSISSTNTSAAQAYEDYLVKPLFGPWACRAIEFAMPAQGETVLDIACGTGIGARLAGPRVSPGGVIISSDNDPGMIAVAEKIVGGFALPSDVRLEWHEWPGERKLVPPGSIDLCLCLQGPQFLDDPGMGLMEMYNAVKSGGRLTASFWNEYHTNIGHHAIGKALQKRGLKPAIKPFSLGGIEHARALIESTGFDIELFKTEQLHVSFASARQFVEGVAAGAPATRHALAQLASSDLELFIGDVENHLSDYQSADGLSLPTSAHLVVARKGR